MPEMEIGHLLIGDEHPPLVIAEIGINHGGCISTAKKMVDAALNAGAKVIKHQTHVVEDEMSLEARSVKPVHVDKSIYDIMAKCALSADEEYSLMQHVESKGGVFVSTPFSRAAFERLLGFGVKAFKIGSGECNNYPLVKKIADAGKPIIMSTGMNTISSIEPSVEIFRENKNQFALLHCTNIYPTPPELVRLGGVQQLKNKFSDAIVGLSDHTTSNHTCFGAVALGASILERHFTDSMEREGPDIINSMDPIALRELIEGSEIIFKARGGSKTIISEEQSTMDFAFVSVVATTDIASGELLTEKNLWVRRPSGGDFGATDLESLFGLVAKNDIPKDTQVRKSDVGVKHKS